MNTPVNATVASRNCRRPLRRPSPPALRLLLLLAARSAMQRGLRVAGEDSTGGSRWPADHRHQTAGTEKVSCSGGWLPPHMKCSRFIQGVLLQPFKRQHQQPMQTPAGTSAYMASRHEPARQAERQPGRRERREQVPPGASKTTPTASVPSRKPAEEGELRSQRRARRLPDQLAMPRVGPMPDCRPRNYTTFAVATPCQAGCQGPVGWGWQGRRHRVERGCSGSASA